MQSFTISGLSRRLSRKFSAVSLFGRQAFKKDCEYDTVDTRRMKRINPRGLDELCIHSKFTRAELQSLYRGFKQECPTGLASEDKFKSIFSQFFPLGDSGRYAQYVFRIFDEDRDGFVNFEDLVMGLASLIQGDVESKVEWAFNLYDLNGDGVVSRDELCDVITSIYELLGRSCNPPVTDGDIRLHVDYVFQKMDLDQDGVITMEEFIEACLKDANIRQSMLTFNTVL